MRTLVQVAPSLKMKRRAWAEDRFYFAPELSFVVACPEPHAHHRQSQGSKSTIWHRMHDHYLNQATHQAVTHYCLVIWEHGTPEQKDAVFGKIGVDGKRHGRGQRTYDLRWELMAQLAEDAQFGNDGHPQLCNLRAGRPMLITPKSGEYKRTRRCRSDGR